MGGTVVDFPFVTKLFRHECPGGHCPPRNSLFAHHDVEQNHLTSSLAGVPIIHRQRYNKKTKTWTTQSFTVQSPDMKAHLQVALAKYQDYDPELENWTFEKPYNAIVHRWDRLNSLCDEAVGCESKMAIDQMLSFLRPIVASSVDSVAETRKSGSISFDDIWQIFPPGELAVTTFFGVEAVCRVLKYEYVRSRPSRWDITLEYIDWNGKTCGLTTTKTIIMLYPGLRFVTSLPAYPLSFNKYADQMKQRFVERGRKFESLRGYHFRNCLGTKISDLGAEEQPVAGRVVIDAFAFYQSNNMMRKRLRPLTSQTTEGGETSDKVHDGSSDDGSESSDDSLVEGPQMTATKGTNRALSRSEDLTPLTDEQCLLATPWVLGLDLKVKAWAKFLVDEIDDIAWNDEAFDHLVLPGEEKELAWAFVENKALSSNEFDDFVQDKGRGIIILMFGPPGVGKTYTAEAVAERSRVPLYSMSAGMLGTSASDVEEALDEALELCKLWNAMLLLDEVDVFVGARTDADLARNELVAVFLAKLEYYQGICFLTTNRINSLDHAFQSRVDLFLRYTDLTTDSRRRVWTNFIKRAGSEKFEVGDEDLDVLSKIKLNGREIKNLIKTAHLLSLKGQDKITVERLQMLAENRLKALEALAV